MVRACGARREENRDCLCRPTQPLDSDARTVCVPCIRAAANEPRCGGNADCHADCISNNNPDYRADFRTHDCPYRSTVFTTNRDIDADDPAKSRAHFTILHCRAN